MLYRDIIDLVTITTTQNAMGDDVEVKVYNQVFANKKPIRSSEFYQAGATGIKPLFMFEISAIDYSGEETIRYQGLEYTLIRPYEKDNEQIELVVKGLVI